MYSLLDDGPHGCNARPGADAYYRSLRVWWQSDEAFLQSDAKLVPWPETCKPRCTDTSTWYLEHCLVLYDRDT